MTALPYGKAIIASRLGLFAELLDQGETAHFVEPGDPATLAAAIAEVAKNPADAGQMGQRGRVARRNCPELGPHRRDDAGGLSQTAFNR